MNPDQAAALGKRVINTMRPTPALPEWVEVLEPLDFDAALRTFRALRDRLDEGLRIATFLTAYGRATGSSARAQTRREPDPDCARCAGCGWVDGPPEYETVNGEQHEYSTVVPCSCTQTRTASRAPTPAAMFEEF
jgi:hypothetical protein